MPSRTLFERDRIELVFSGTLRRAADYRMEDASGLVLGQIAEHITRRRRRTWGRAEPFRPHWYEVTDASGAILASSSSWASWSGLRGEISDARGVRLAGVFRAPRAAMFPVSIGGSGSLCGMQVIRRSGDGYAAQFVDRTGNQIAQIEAIGSNMHGWRNQFLSYRVTFASTAEQNQRLVVLGVIPILHMTYVAPRG